MRYLGNKARIVDTIIDVAKRTCDAWPLVHDGVLDIFGGTGTVGHAFKSDGCVVTCNDRLMCSYVLQAGLVAYQGWSAELADVQQELESAQPFHGPVTRLYSPSGREGRRFFTTENAESIDGMLRRISDWAESQYYRVSGEAILHLLAGVLEGASAVANTTGMFGAYLKEWQSNALAPFRPIYPRSFATTRPCVAIWGDAIEVAASRPCQLLYVDPPYNHREYAANYHVLDVMTMLALAPSQQEREAIEARVYGKSGLYPYKRSRFSSRKEAKQAFHELFERAHFQDVLVSYSEEGLLTLDEMREAIAHGARCSVADVHGWTIDHKRYRADRDGAARRYAPPDASKPNRVQEWLLHARRV